MKRTRETKRPPFSIRHTCSVLKKGQGVYQFFASGIILLYLIAGCTEAEVINGGSQGQDTREVEAAFNLQVMPGEAPLTRSLTLTASGTTITDTLSVATPDTLQTRAGTDPGSVAEQKISDVWVGQYDTAGNLIHNEYVAEVTENKVIVKLKPTSPATCHIWFVTNAGNLATTAAATAIPTEDGLKKYQLSCTTADGGLPEGLCAMTGMWEGAVPKTGIAIDQANAIPLTRLMAKITFAYEIDKTSSFSFTPTSVSLKQLSDKTQIGAPASSPHRPDGITYDGSYSLDLSGTDLQKTIDWYLGENIAGDGKSVTSLKDRIGEGVTNATCIELAGDAVQDGVNYNNVLVRFYPGDPAELSNYDIRRNGHYSMNITLRGLDMTDKRITIGDIPPITSPASLPAAKGGTADVQLTTRPGQAWILDLPLWLSATIEGKTPASAGSRLEGKGPCKLTFEAVESNPRAEVRDMQFPIAIEEGKPDQTLTLTQEASVLDVPGGNRPTPVLVEAAAGSTGTFSFTATAGLQWDAMFSNDSLNWSGSPVLDNETTGEQETYTIAAIYLNPSKKPRTLGTITVRAGASVGNPTYAGLIKKIPVTQKESTLTVSRKDLEFKHNGEINSVTGTNTITVGGTSGLAWTVTPAVETNGIQANPTDGILDGENQTISFTASENTGSVRTQTFNITVPNSDHTSTVTVTQMANPIVTIDNNMLYQYSLHARRYSSPSGWMVRYPPFDEEGKDTATSHNLEVNWSNPTMIGSYQFEVETTQNQDSGDYKTRKEYCRKLANGWRLPTIIELYAIWDKAKGSDDNATDKDVYCGTFGAYLKPGGYVSSSRYEKDAGKCCTMSLNNGILTWGDTTGGSTYVRCVRDL